MCKLNKYNYKDLLSLQICPLTNRLHEVLNICTSDITWRKRASVESNLQITRIDSINWIGWACAREHV